MGEKEVTFKLATDENGNKYYPFSQRTATIEQSHSTHINALDSVAHTTSERARASLFIALKYICSIFVWNWS